MIIKDEVNISKVIGCSMMLGVLIGVMVGGLIGYDIGNDDVKTVTETEIVYINQTDNCLNEIVNIWEQSKEIKETVMKYLEVEK